jgi:uncharacterized tellurite resistance protein B-like protein
MFDTVIQYLESLSAGNDKGFASEDRNLAIAALFYHMIAVDGVIKPVEKMRFNGLLEQKFDLSIDTLAEFSSKASEADLQSTGLFPFTSIINHSCSRAEKAEIVEQMKLLARSDGECHPLEALLIQNIEELLKLSGEENSESTGTVMAFLDKIRALMGPGTTVQRVADDQQLTAELILLVRMMFADGEMKPDELAQFKEICATRCDIPEEDIPDVVKFLTEFGYETTVENAAGMFADMEVEHKRAILRRMVRIAHSDDELDPMESLMIQRTADILGLTMMDAFAPKP